MRRDVITLDLHLRDVRIINSFVIPDPHAPLSGLQFGQHQTKLFLEYLLDLFAIENEKME